MMNSDAGRNSAKIYQFPVRPRMSSGPRGAETLPNSGAARRAAVSIGSAWYHDAAIQQEQDRKG
jgi:hypothetical protein